MKADSLFETNRRMKKGEIMDNANAKVMSVATLLKCNLRIPAYQRPYKWTEKNMRELLNDVSKALESKEIHDNYEYRSQVA